MVDIYGRKQEEKEKRFNDMRKLLIAKLEQIRAVEVLEYHNKNFLANMKSVSEMKQSLILDCLNILDKYQLD